MRATFHQVEMGPGMIREIGFTPGQRVERPSIVLQERGGPRQPVTRLRGLMLNSIRIDGVEQLPEGISVPAYLMDHIGLEALELPPVDAGSRLVCVFVNPLGMPRVSFRCWFGSRGGA
jgi:hypothetical protein